GRRPHGACSNLREKGRQDRASHRLTPLLRLSRSEGSRVCGAHPSDGSPSRRSPSVFPSLPARPASPPGRLMVALAALVLIVAACTGSSGATPAPTSSTAVATIAPTATPLPTPSPTPTPAFPATLKDDEGTSVTIASQPKRIV